MNILSPDPSSTFLSISLLLLYLHQHVCYLILHNGTHEGHRLLTFNLNALCTFQHRPLTLSVACFVLIACFVLLFFFFKLEVFLWAWWCVKWHAILHHQHINNSHLHCTYHSKCTYKNQGFQSIIDLCALFFFFQLMKLFFLLFIGHIRCSDITVMAEAST